MNDLQRARDLAQVVARHRESFDLRQQARSRPLRGREPVGHDAFFQSADKIGHRGIIRVLLAVSADRFRGHVVLRRCGFVAELACVNEDARDPVGRGLGSWLHRSAQPRPGHPRCPPPRERREGVHVVREREVNAERRGKAVHVSAPVLVERGTRFHGDPRAATRARQHAVPVGRRQVPHVARLVFEAATARTAACLGLRFARWFEDLHGVARSAFSVCVSPSIEWRGSGSKA